MKLGGGVLGRGGLEGRRKERKLEIEEDDEAAMDEVCGFFFFFFLIIGFSNCFKRLKNSVFAHTKQMHPNPDNTYN